MKDKAFVLRTLREEYDRWDALLTSLGEQQVVKALEPWEQSVKDVIAHLHAWQQITNARVEAAHANREPVLPDWVGVPDPDREEALEGINARIYARYKQASLEEIYSAWREGFLKLIERAEALPETEMLDKQKFPWMKGFSIYDVLYASYLHHHEEHLDPLLTWLRQNGLAEG